MYNCLSLENKKKYVYQRGLLIGNDVVHDIPIADYIQIQAGFELRSHARKIANKLNKHFHRQLFHIECVEAGYGAKFHVVYNIHYKPPNVIKKLKDSICEWMT